MKTPSLFDLEKQYKALSKTIKKVMDELNDLADKIDFSKIDTCSWRFIQSTEDYKESATDEEKDFDCIEDFYNNLESKLNISIGVMLNDIKKFKKHRAKSIKGK